MLTRSPSFKHQRSDIETQGRRFATACKIPQSRKQPRRKFGAGTFEVHYVEREAGSRKDGNLRVAGLRTVRLWSLAARPDRKARLAGLHTANRGRYPGVPRKPKGRRLGSGKTASKAEACIQARHHSEMTPARSGRGFFVCLPIASSYPPEHHAGRRSRRTGGRSACGSSSSPCGRAVRVDIPACPGAGR